MAFFRWAAVGAIAMMLAGAATPAFAVDTSLSSDDMGYPREVCQEKTQHALAREGWGDIRQGPEWLQSGVKGPMRVYILCIYRASGTVVVIFVAGDPGTSAYLDGERDRLRHRMTR
jgi:hypothetical protein